MKENLHPPAGNILQCTCYDNAHKEHEGNAVAERIKYMQHRQSSASIDGAVRPGEKSAVDECMCRDATVDAFAEPAEKAVQEEI